MIQYALSFDNDDMGDVASDLLLLGQLPGFLAVTIVTISCTSIPTSPPDSADDNTTDEADRVRTIFTYLLLAIFSVVRLLGSIPFTIARNWRLLLSLLLVAGVTLLQNEQDSVILRETDAVVTELWPPIFEVIDVIATAIRILSHTFLTLTNYINGTAKLIFFTLGTITLECEFYSLSDSALALAQFAIELALSLAEFVVQLGLEDLNVSGPITALQVFVDTFRGPATKCWCNDVGVVFDILFDIVVSSPLADALDRIVNFFISYTRTVLLFAPRFVTKLIECLALSGQEQAICFMHLPPRIDDITDNFQLIGIHLGDWIDVITNAIFGPIDDAIEFPGEPSACCYECVHPNSTVFDASCRTAFDNGTCPDVVSTFCQDPLLFPNAVVTLNISSASCVSFDTCPAIIAPRSLQFPNISRITRAPFLGAFSFAKYAARLPAISGFGGVFLFDTVLVDMIRDLFHMLTHPQSLLQRGYVSEIVNLDKDFPHIYNMTEGIAVFFTAFATDPTDDIGCVIAESLNITLQFAEIITRLPATIVTLDPFPLEFLRTNASNISLGILRDADDLGVCGQSLAEEISEATGQVVRESVFLVQNLTKLILDITANFDDAEALLDFLLSQEFREELETVTFTFDNYYIALGNLLQQLSYSPGVTCELKDPRTRPGDGDATSLGVDPLCCTGGLINSLLRFINGILRSVTQASLEIIAADGVLDTSDINRLFLAPNAPLRWRDNLIPRLDEVAWTGSCIAPSLLSIIPCPGDESISLGAAITAVASTFNNITGPLPLVFASPITRIFDTFFNVYAQAATGQCATTPDAITNCVCPPLVMIYDFSVGNFFFVIRNALQLAGCIVPGEFGDDLIAVGEFLWSLFGWDDEDSLHFLLCDVIETIARVLDALVLLFTDPEAFFELLGEALLDFFLEILEPIIGPIEDFIQDVEDCFDVIVSYINFAYALLKYVFNGGFFNNCLGFIGRFVDSCLPIFVTCDTSLLTLAGCTTGPVANPIDSSQCPLFSALDIDPPPTFGACCADINCAVCTNVSVSSFCAGHFLGSNSTCPTGDIELITCCFPGSIFCSFCTENVHPAVCSSTTGATILGVNVSCPGTQSSFSSQLSESSTVRPFVKRGAQSQRHLFNITNLIDMTFVMTNPQSPCWDVIQDASLIHHDHYIEKRDEIYQHLNRSSFKPNEQDIIRLLTEMHEPSYNAAALLLKERVHKCVHSFLITRLMDAVIGVPDPRRHVFPPIMFTSVIQTWYGLLEVIGDLSLAASYSSEFQEKRMREKAHNHTITEFLTVDKGLHPDDDYAVIHWTKWWNHKGRAIGGKSGHIGGRLMRISHAVGSHWNRARNLTRSSHNKTMLEGVTDSLHMLHGALHYGLNYVVNSTGGMLSRAQKFSDRMSHIGAVVSHRHDQHRARIENRPMPLAPWRQQSSLTTFSTGRSLLQHAECVNNSNFIEIPPLDFGTTDCLFVELTVDEFALLTERTVQAWQCIGLTNIPSENISQTFAEYCVNYTFAGTDGDWEVFVAPETVPMVARTGMAGDVITAFETVFGADISRTLGAFVGFVSNTNSSDQSSLRFWLRKIFSCRVTEEGFCEHGPEGLGGKSGALWTFLIVVGLQLIFLAIFTVNPLTARFSLILSFFLFFALAYLFSPFCFIRTALLWPISRFAWFAPVINTPVLGLLFKASAIPVLPGCLPVEIYCGFVDPLRFDCIPWEDVGLGGLTDTSRCPTSQEDFEREFLDCSADPFNMIDIRVVTFWLQREFPSLNGVTSSFLALLRIFTPSAARFQPFTDAQLEDEEFLSCARLRGPLNIALVISVVAFVGPIIFAVLFLIPLLLIVLLYLIDMISDFLTAAIIEGGDFEVNIDIELSESLAEWFPSYSKKS